jgi:hypothetical protein
VGNYKCATTTNLIANVLYVMNLYAWIVCEFVNVAPDWCVLPASAQNQFALNITVNCVGIIEILLVDVKVVKTPSKQVNKLYFIVLVGNGV